VGTRRKTGRFGVGLEMRLSWLTVMRFGVGMGDPGEEM
jgi:hypothetical protein